MQLLPALFFLTLWGMSVGCKYDKVGRHHTMCIYRAHACPNSKLLRSGGISKADKNLIVKLHNQVRSNLAMGKVRGLPPAADMRVMTWDDELARIAQRWADQCTEGHDAMRNTEREFVGQNVALQWTYNYKDPILQDKPDWASRIYRWGTKEISDYGFSSGHIKPFVYQDNVGHYTQMIWAETHQIGCGFTYYKDSWRGYTKIYVCNYAPGGNMRRGTMYNTSPRGATCNDPSLEFSTEYKGLCEKRRHNRGNRWNSNRRRRAPSHTRHVNTRTSRFTKKQNIRKTKTRESKYLH